MVAVKKSRAVESKIRVREQNPDDLKTTMMRGTVAIEKTKTRRVGGKWVCSC